MELIFWILVALIFYAYLGYGIILLAISIIKRIFFALFGVSKKTVKHQNNDFLPSVTLFVAAYNEKDFIDAKIKNAFAQDYPSAKITHLWVTDGSDDGTPELLKKHKDITVLHEAERNGKIGAINRGMKYVETPIVIFSDGNTMLSTNAVSEIVSQFEDPKIGCVAGEKKIELSDSDSAATAGEGIYWKYESFIKKLDSELNTSVGAVGELFAIRTSLFKNVEPDTLLDDFIISLRIAMQGYKIQYAPKAIATESASENIREELKRKIRISAGSVQSLIRLAPLLNPFKYGLLSIQYISHKVIRWYIPPFALPLILIFNIFLANSEQLFFSPEIYILLLYSQILFYFIASAGWFFEKYKIRFKLFFIPYYICMINYAVIAGIIKYSKGKQSVKWERAQRKTNYQ